MENSASRTQSEPELIAQVEAAKVFARSLH